MHTSQDEDLQHTREHTNITSITTNDFSVPIMANLLEQEDSHSQARFRTPPSKLNQMEDREPTGITKKSHPSYFYIGSEYLKEKETYCSESNPN